MHLYCTTTHFSFLYIHLIVHSNVCLCVHEDILAKEKFVAFKTCWPNIILNICLAQGGRSWQPFGEGKEGHKNFRQARIYFFFCGKCVVFARDCKFENLTEYNMPYGALNRTITAKNAQNQKWSRVFLCQIEF